MCRAGAEGIERFKILKIERSKMHLWRAPRLPAAPLSEHPHGGDHPHEELQAVPVEDLVVVELDLGKRAQQHGPSPHELRRAARCDDGWKD